MGGSPRIADSSILPNVDPGACGLATCNWGESPLSGGRAYYCPGLESADGIDLVNSVQLAFAASNSQPAKVSLLAPDRAEIPSLPAGYIPISVWKFEAAGGATTINSLLFRCDNTRISAEGETTLRLMRYLPSTGPWEDLCGYGGMPAHCIRTPTGYGTTLSTGAVYYAVVGQGWSWTGAQDNSWTTPGNWAAQSPLAGYYPNDTTCPAWVASGGAVTASAGSPAAETLYLGYTPVAGAAVLNLTGGTLNLHSLRMGAISQLATGVCNLSGGSALSVSGDIVVGENGFGTMSQGAATVSGPGADLVDNVLVALYPTSTGTYDLGSGTLGAARVSIGVEGNGTFTIHGGTISGVRSLTVRETLHAQGELTGYGSVVCDAAAPYTVLTNNGRVTADGQGQECDLDLSGFHYGTYQGSEETDLGVQNSFDNVPANGVFSVGAASVDFGATHNGWYAVNKGRLVLPDLNFDYIETPTFNWGESPWQLSTTAVPLKVGRGHDIDLVNSMQFELDLGSTPWGLMSISLLATDRSEAPIQTLRTLGHPIAVWQFGPDSAGAIAHVTVRYDESNSDVTTTMPPACKDTPTETWLALVQWVPDTPWTNGYWTIIGRPEARWGRHQIRSTNSVAFGEGTYFAVLQGYPGDFNLDGAVDVIDLLMMIDVFGSTLGDGRFDAVEDINGDGAVDVLDLLILIDTFGTYMGSAPCTQQSEQTSNLQAILDQATGEDLPGTSLMGTEASEGARAVEDSPQQTLYEVLRATGTLDQVLEYVNNHPEVVP